MPAIRNLSKHANPSLFIVAAATMLALGLRAANADLGMALCCLLIALTLSAMSLLPAAFRARRRQQETKPGPNKLVQAAVLVSAIALWGITLGGGLLVSDRKPFLDAVIETRHNFLELLIAKQDVEQAKDAYERASAKHDFNHCYDRAFTALDQVRQTGPRYRLAWFVFALGLIAGALSLILVPIAYYRRMSCSRVIQLAT